MGREEALFCAALDRPSPDEVRSYLDDACAGDQQLRGRVERLLAAHAGADSLLDPPRDVVAVTRDVGPAISERPGDQIGPYKLIQQLGEGGMGVVYMAQQTEPVKRLVALKIIKPGMDSRQVIARFEAERQALALMDHPNIAKVLDAGTTQSGRPYFVMELVKGIPITQYCDEKRLTPKERLELFVPVCHAVQHAHQKGIIHRDLKPSNVMIALYDGRPVPKVIDFGVAMATGGQLTEKTLVTGFGSLVGTLEYMSPEQAELNQLDVDTRRDIYALGVLLYELLTGDTPFDRQRLRSAAFDEMLRIIREEEPPRPSTRLGTSGSLPAIAASRHIEPGKLAGLIRGELDWIVMKALEKDRSRRYETANGLALDIRRYLDDEPVIACPPSLSYKLSKVARRYKTAQTVATGLAALLLGGIAVSTWQAVRATTAEQAAVASEQRWQHESARAIAYAKVARDNEQIAENERDAARAAKDELARNSYTSDMRAVSADWEAGETAYIPDILDRHRPRAGETDLRGFEWHYWNRLANADRTVQLPTRNLVTAGISPDGRWIAGIYGEPKQYGLDAVGIWSLATGDLRFKLPAFDYDQANQRLDTYASRFEFSADSKRIAYFVPIHRPRTSASVDLNEVRVGVFDLEAGKKVSEVTHRGVHLSSGKAGKPSAPNGVVASDLKRMVLLKEAPLRAVVLDVATGAELVTLLNVPDTCDAISLAISEDGARVAGGLSLPFTASGRPNGQLYVWETDTGKQLLAQQWVDHDIGCVAISPVGASVAAGDFFADSVGLWDVAKGEQLWAAKSPIKQTVGGLRFSPDGMHLACWSTFESSVAVLNAISGSQHSTYFEHSRILCGNGVQFLAGNKQLAAAAKNGSVKLWSLPSKASAVGERDDFVGTDVMMGPDAQRIVVYSQPRPDYANSSSSERKTVPGRSDISVRDLTGRETLRFREHRAAVSSVRVLREGKAVASVDVSGTTHNWNPVDGALIHTIPGQSPPEMPVVPFNPSPVPRLETDYGRILAIVIPESGMTLIDIDSGKPVFRLTEMPNIYSRQISANGSRVATSQRLTKDLADSVTKVWDVASGKELFQLFKGYLQAARLSPDGHTLIATQRIDSGIPSSIADTFLKVWDLHTGTEQPSFMIAQGSGSVLAISPDGTRLVTDRQFGDEAFTHAREVVVWDLPTRRELFHLRTRFGRTIATFSPDGKRIATRTQSSLSESPSFSGRKDAEAAVRLWDASTGEELTCLARDVNATSIRFSSDGHRLIAFGPTSVRVWDATPREVVPAAE